MLGFAYSSPTFFNLIIVTIATAKRKALAVATAAQGSQYSHWPTLGFCTATRHHERSTAEFTTIAGMLSHRAVQAAFLASDRALL